MKQVNLITQLKNQTLTLIKEVEALDRLNLTELAHQKSSSSWNALQCIDHLNSYSEFYLNEFKTKIGDAKKSRTLVPYKIGFWGKLFTNGMLPDENMKKMKTFKSKDPINKKLNKKVLSQFIEDQQLFLTLLEKTNDLDLNKNNCQITIPLVQMRLGDTLTFYVYHNIRHVDQAKKAIN